MINNGYSAIEHTKRRNNYNVIINKIDKKCIQKLYLAKMTSLLKIRWLSFKNSGKWYHLISNNNKNNNHDSFDNFVFYLWWLVIVIVKGFINIIIIDHWARSKNMNGKLLVLRSQNKSTRN